MKDPVVRRRSSPRENPGIGQPDVRSINAIRLRLPSEKSVDGQFGGGAVVARDVRQASEILAVFQRLLRETVEKQGCQAEAPVPVEQFLYNRIR